jgi:hypothetical protein
MRCVHKEKKQVVWSKKIISDPRPLAAVACSVPSPPPPPPLLPSLCRGREMGVGPGDAASARILLLASSAATALDEPRDGLQAAFGGEFDGSSVAVAFSSSDLLLWAAGAWRSMRSLGASAGSAASLTSFN